MSFDLSDTDQEFEEELQELQDELNTNISFDSNNSTFEEEEFSANFVRTLFISRYNQSTMSNIQKFLGKNNQIRTTDRTPQELSTEAKLYPKENRADLKKKDAKSYQRMVEKACEGVDTKFCLLEPITETDGPERLKKSYNVMTRMKELKKSLQENDMDDVFIIPKDFDDDGVPTSNEYVDILDTIYGITIEQVTTASALYALKSSASWHPQNIAWSGKKILASCEDDLKEKVIEAAEQIPKSLRGGPVYLYLMSKLILATSEKAMRGLTDKISSLQLSNFSGENVLTAGSYLKSAMNLFRAHDKVPKDINLLIFKIFRESTTTEFNSYVGSIESNLDTAPLFGKEVTMTPEDMINAFESKYTDLLGRGEWEAKSTTSGQESGFSAESSSQDVMCFNCGMIGHTSPNCTKPHDEKAIEIRRKLVLGTKTGGRGGGRRGGRGGGDRGGRGRGRAGGRGRGGGTPSQDTKPELSAEEKKKKVLKTPPAAGESHEKVIDGTKRLWCGRCGTWGDHKTADHPSKDDGSKKTNGEESKLAVHVLTGAMGSNF
jgi:hypothetical protein